MADDVSERLRVLEETTSHQAMELEQLDETVRLQWEKIDELTKALLRFRDRLTEVEETGSGPENTRPPHY